MPERPGPGMEPAPGSELTAIRLVGREAYGKVPVPR